MGTVPESFGDNWGTIGPLRLSDRRTAASQAIVFPHAEEGNRTPKGVSPGDFESIPIADSSVEHEPRRCFYSQAVARALRPFMACAVEKADKRRTAAFYLVRARALRSHGQFTDSAEKLPCSCGVSSTQGIRNPMTVPISRALMPAHHPTQPCLVDPRAVRVTSLAVMRTLIAALVLATASLVGAQV